MKLKGISRRRHNLVEYNMDVIRLGSFQDTILVYDQKQCGGNIPHIYSVVKGLNSALILVQFESHHTKIKRD